MGKQNKSIKSYERALMENKYYKNIHRGKPPINIRELLILNINSIQQWVLTLIKKIKRGPKGHLSFIPRNL